MNSNKYVQLMCQLKIRLKVINDILSKKESTTFRIADIEFMCLQLRKVLELISLSSLVANKKEFDNEQIKYHKFWNARLILKDIEKLNKDFYPKPVLNDKEKLVEIKEGVLTKENFIKVYEKLGKIMHNDNPFGSKTDYKHYEEEIAKWTKQITKLLERHLVKLKGSDGFYLIHLENEKNNRPCLYKLELIEE